MTGLLLKEMVDLLKTAVSTPSRYLRSEKEAQHAKARKRRLNEKFAICGGKRNKCAADGSLGGRIDALRGSLGQTVRMIRRSGVVRLDQRDPSLGPVEA